MKYCFLILSLFCSLSLSAQTLVGKVVSEKGKPVGGANITLLTSGGTTIAYTVSGKDGIFSISYQEIAHPQKLVVSMVGYEKQMIPLSSFKSGADITLKEKQFLLKEVKVTAKRINLSGDTLTYSVAGFKQKQDRSIADVIAKMPGLEVKDGGQILYQGKPINKFYIEGMDMMGSKYAQASNNISAQKVKSVQVLQNHQPIKMLRGTRFSDQAALNIVLTDDSKDLWMGTADIGLGTRLTHSPDMLRDSRLMAMRFGRKSQNLSMYKTNNNGKDISSEVNDMYTLFRPTHEEQKLLSPFSISLPDMDGDRYTFNNAHLGATNQLFKLTEDDELRLQLNVLLNREHQNSSTRTQYLELDVLPIVSEQRAVTNTDSQWQGEMLYKLNGKKCFVQNKIKGYIDFDKSRATLLYNEEEHQLTVQPRSRYITEDFQMIKNMKNGLDMDISSVSTYNYLPGRLITINELSEILNLKYFGTSNYVKFGRKAGRFIIDNKVGIDFYHQQMNADLSGQQTNHTFWLAQPYYNPDLIFKTPTINANIAANISVGRQFYNGRTKNALWIEPSFSFRYILNAVSSLYLNYIMNQSPTMLKGIYDTPLFTSYRTIESGIGNFETRTTHQAYLWYDYAQPANGLFYNLNTSLSMGNNNVLYTTSLTDYLYRRIATEHRYHNRLFSAQGKISKTFGWAKTFLSLSTSYQCNNYKLLIDSSVDDGRLQTGNISLKYSFRPFLFVSLEGKSSLYLSQQTNISEPQYSGGSSKYYKQHFDINFFIGSDWQLSVKNEYYHSTEKGFADNTFCDALLSYRHNKFELQLSLNNIWNNNHSEQLYMSSAAQTYTFCQLRPREIMMKVSFDL